MEDVNVLKETMKKSAFIAKSEYDYRKLTFSQSFLLEMELEEEKEELILGYQVRGKKALIHVKEEDILTILAVLISVKTLQYGLGEYSFSMDPYNLYYDMNHQVYGKVRDVYTAGQGFDEKDFLHSYQALVGFAMQNKYAYGDFREGGDRLFLKNPLLTSIKEAETPERIGDILEAEYDRIEQERKGKKRMVGKGTYRGMKAGLIVLTGISLLSLGFAGYGVFKQGPYQKAVIEAGNAYIAGDYVSCIDAMKQIDVSEMEQTQKYILANAYVKGENLTQEQKTNISETLSLNAVPVRLEYWIYLGRGDTEKAEDIAMGQSDDQLLLYAYMKRRGAVESSTSLSGEEKNKQLEAINSKMEPLMERYDTAESENTKGAGDTQR